MPAELRFTVALCARKFSHLGRGLTKTRSGVSATTQHSRLFSTAEPPRHPLPPFSETTAREKVQAAEDAWNSRDPDKVSKAYSIDSVWRNRSTFLKGRDEIRRFLDDKWQRESEYSLKKHYFSHTDNKIAVTFQYEYINPEGQTIRAYGNEHWTFDDNGYMKVRNASINDVVIEPQQRILDPKNPSSSASALEEYSDGTKYP